MYQKRAARKFSRLFFDASPKSYTLGAPQRFRLIGAFAMELDIGAAHAICTVAVTWLIG